MLLSPQTAQINNTRGWEEKTNNSDAIKKNYSFSYRWGGVSGAPWGRWVANVLARFLKPQF